MGAVEINKPPTSAHRVRIKPPNHDAQREYLAVIANTHGLTSFFAVRNLRSSDGQPIINKTIQLTPSIETERKENKITGQRIILNGAFADLAADEGMQLTDASKKPDA